VQIVCAWIIILHKVKREMETNSMVEELNETFCSGILANHNNSLF
jgi:hypothetical protein